MTAEVWPCGWQGRFKPTLIETLNTKQYNTTKNNTRQHNCLLQPRFKEDLKKIQIKFN